jgi:hypothetical protein
MRHAKILEWSALTEDRIIGPWRGGAMSLPTYSLPRVIVAYLARRCKRVLKEVERIEIINAPLLRVNIRCVDNIMM